MGLSQQKLADMMKMKRGKVAGYFYDTQPRPEFYEKFGEQFDLNIGRFLTVEITDKNYDSFFLSKSRASDMISEPKEDYITKSELIDLLIKAKNSDSESMTNELIDRAIQLYGKILDENSKLKDANSDLKDQLLEMSIKLTKKNR